MQSRLASLFLALFAFGLFAYASPVTSKDVAVARAATGLDAILAVLLDLQAKIKVHLDALVKLDVNADISVIVGPIVVLIKACITALVSVGAVVDLSDKDKISVIANVCAQILIVRRSFPPFHNAVRLTADFAADRASSPRSRSSPRSS